MNLEHNTHQPTTLCCWPSTVTVTRDGGPAGRRGKETRNSGARASEIGRRPLLFTAPWTRVLIDDFHRIWYSKPDAALH